MKYQKNNMLNWLMKKKSQNHQVALIKIFGEINENNPLIEHALHTLQILKNTKIDTLILHISGTGGAISVAQELSEEIRKFVSATSCSVLTYIGESAFSASFYLALSGDKVFCQPGSLVGSVGAIIKHKNFEELYKKIGITQEVIASSIQKDLFSTSRKISTIEKESLTVVVNDIHLQFVNWILLRRNATAQDISNYLDGRIFTGALAKDLGLVDQYSTVTGILKIIQLENKLINLPDLTIYEPKLAVHNSFGNMIQGLKTLLQF